MAAGTGQKKKKAITIESKSLKVIHRSLCKDLLLLTVRISQPSLRLRNKWPAPALPMRPAMPKSQPSCWARLSNLAVEETDDQGSSKTRKRNSSDYGNEVGARRIYTDRGVPWASVENTWTLLKYYIPFHVAQSRLDSRALLNFSVWHLAVSFFS